MKRLVLIALLLLPVSAFGQIALVGYTGAGSTNTLSVTIPNATNSPTTSKCTTSSCDTTGSTLIVASVSYYFGGAVNQCNTFDDNKGNTYKLDTRHGTTNNAVGVVFYYAIGPVVGPGHIWTCHADGINAQYQSVEVSFYSGSVGLFDLSGGTANAGGTTTIQRGSISPRQNNELVVASCSSNEGSTVTFSFDGGFTKLADMPSVGSASVHGAQAYLVQTATAAANPTCTNGTSSSSGLAANIISFTLTNSNSCKLKNLRNGWECLVSVSGDMGTNGGSTIGIDTTGANQLAFVLSYYNGVTNGCTPTDTVGGVSTMNTWTLAKGSAAAGGTIVDGNVYLSNLNPTVGANHVITCTGTTLASAGALLAFKNAASSALDQTSAAGDPLSGSHTIQAASVTPGQGNELILQVLAFGGAAGADLVSIDSNYTVLEDWPKTGGDQGVSVAVITQSTAAATSPTWTLNLGSYMGAVAVTLKRGAAVSFGDPDFLLLRQ